MKTLRTFKAELSHSSPDLAWIVWTPEFKRLFWTGYNDSYWWDKVAKSAEFCEKTDEEGRKWTLDPHTNLASVVLDETTACINELVLKAEVPA